MNTPQLSGDPLFELECRIARRADALDRLLGIDPGHALDHWRQAEREVLAQTFPFETPLAPTFDVGEDRR